MNILVKMDKKIEKAISVLSKKLCWLTGKDNFWWAKLLGKISALSICVGVAIMLISWNIFVLGNLKSIAWNLPIIFIFSCFLSWAGFHVLGFFHPMAILILEENSNKNSQKEIQAIDPEAYTYKKVYELVRIPFLFLWPPMLALSGWSMNFTIKSSLLAISFGILAFCFVLGASAMYFSTVETPPKKRVRIKEWIKSLFTVKLPIFAPVPIPGK